MVATQGGKDKPFAESMASFPFAKHQKNGARCSCMLGLFVLLNKTMTMRAFAVCCIVCMIGSPVAAQVFPGWTDSINIPRPLQHYQAEYTFDTVVDAQRWTLQSPGLHCSFASTDQLYFRREVPPIPAATSYSATGWRGERINAEVLVWSADALEQVQVNIGDLSGPGGAIIGKSNVHVYTVNYVLSNFPYNATNTNCGESPYTSGFLMPDRFEDLQPFDLPGKTVRSVWISVDIPATTAPGNYAGTISVRTPAAKTDLRLSISVQNMVLPKPHEWKHRLDLWQNPWVVAWHYNLRPWSPEHKALLKQHLKLYADAGGKYITTYAVHSPWSDNSYMIEGGMIEWIRTANGPWKFDYTIFDDYVQLAMDAGVDQAITIYTPVPWGNRFRYRDARTGFYREESWPPDSPMFRQVWNAFLTDLRSHLQQKGWLDKTYLGINENAMEQTLAAIRVIRQHSKNWRITYAGDWHPELDTLLNDYSYLYGKEPNDYRQMARKKRGMTTTFYVCCNPAKPNNFVFSPPIEGRWISWYTAARGYDGFLRWAYDAWPADPTRDARHTLWPAGDCFLVYPGGGSSIRFEKLREGITDFEKIRILREKAAQSRDPQVQRVLQQLNDHLKLFASEHNFETATLKDQVDTGKKLLQSLTQLVSK